MRVVVLRLFTANAQKLLIPGTSTLHNIVMSSEQSDETSQKYRDIRDLSHAFEMTERM